MAEDQPLERLGDIIQPQSVELSSPTNHQEGTFIPQLGGVHDIPHSEARASTQPPEHLISLPTQPPEHLFSLPEAPFQREFTPDESPFDSGFETSKVFQEPTQETEPCLAA